METRALVILPVLILLLPCTPLAGQGARTGEVPLRNWPAPLYWQPAAPEAVVTGLRPEIREPKPNAATPAGSLVFVAMTPCRVVDTRSNQGFTGEFGPPGLSPYPSAIRNFQIQLSPNCSIPSIAQAYSLNVTIVPNPLGVAVGFLTLYPTAVSPNLPPNAVTLDDYPTGDIRNNAAIVPAGINNGSVSAVTNGNLPDMVIDINGYYAPSTGITLAQGSAAAPSLSFSGDAGTGMFSTGTGTLNFVTGGTNRLAVRSDGDLDLAGSVRKSGTLFLHNLGTENAALGLAALSANMGTSNTATGFNALANNTLGSWNTACGAGALASNTTGTSNTALGYAAGSSGSSNTSVGYIAGDTGSNNTAIGYQAGTATTGTNNSALGYRAGANIASGSNNIHIGHTGMSADDSVVRIGTSGTQTSFFAAGIAGSPVSGAAVLIDGSTGQLGIASSSRRYKEDIAEMGDASSALLQLRPVTFRYRKPYADGSKPLDYGLIAEEVAELYPDLVSRNAEGQIETVQYQKLTPMLLNELQKLQARVSALQKALETLLDGKVQPTGDVVR